MDSISGGFDPKIVDDASKLMDQFGQTRMTMKALLRTFVQQEQITPESRAQLETIVLGTIRYQNTIDFLATRSITGVQYIDLPQQVKNRLRILIFMTRWLNWSIANFHDEFLVNHVADYLAVLEKAKGLDISRLTKNLNEVNILSLKYSHPSFIVKTLLDNLPRDQVIAHLKADNITDEQYMRVNHLLDDGSVLEEIRNLSVELEPDPDIPGLYVIKDGIGNIVKSEFFQKRKVIIQDKSSVIAVHTLNPQSDEIIWDCCAAPGMKTQLILETIAEQGKVIASDISWSRLSIATDSPMIPQHLPVNWLLADASRPPIEYADKILIDAPCTSTGMLQTHPSFKWKLNKRTLVSLMSIQNKILTGVVSHFSKYPGTEIVYSTCSILPHEGESQIDSLLSSHDVELLDGPDFGHPGYSKFSCSSKVRRLFPHIHHTNGFFIARLRIPE